MKKILFLSVLIFISSIFYADAQLKPIVTKAKYFDKTPPLREMKFIVVPGIRDRSWKDGVIPNEGPDFPGVPEELRDSGPDPVWQSDFGRQKSNGTHLNFEGTGNVNGVFPPDTDGDVGPNHYFQMINLSFQIWDKDGNSLYGPADNSTLWDGFIGPWTGHNDGDPIVVYDELADRWVASQFALECTGSTWWELVAVSATPDPLGPWYRYAFEYPVFNDYPKLSVWPDAYYCSFNLFGDDNVRVGASAYEREAMLNGDTNARHVLFDLPPELLTWSMLPADFDGIPPLTGSPCYWTCGTDDDDGIHDADQIRIWEFSVDWNQPENSTFEELQQLDVEAFNYQLCDAGARQACIPQPDGAPLLETLAAYLMQPLQYRNFGTYETMVCNHTVNADGNGLAGIRWYELRKENEVDGWYIYQQGTYAPDEHHRWMGSMAMDARGYIALGYTVSSTTVYPSLRYTGRAPGDPLGQMTFTEESIIEGSGSQLSVTNRWGDYSMMAVDPVNDTTFWYTGEYFQTTGGDNWQTRIAAFNLLVDNTAPAAIADLQSQSTTTNAVQLKWTATGNNGNQGAADVYDIRYSPNPITETNWDAAMIAENDLIPLESGNEESFTVEGLDYNTEYYFAIKAGDRQENISEISNVMTGNVAGPPIVALEEDEVELKIFDPCAANRPWIIENTGETDLKYHIFKELVKIPGTAGNLLGTYENAALLNRGMCWAEGYMYIVDLFGSFVYKYDTALQQKIDTFTVHSEPFGICWDEEYLWIGDGDGEIHAYNPDGTSADMSFSCPFSEYATLTYNGHYFVVSKISLPYPVLYFIDYNGDVQKTFKTGLTNTLRQLSWVGSHYYKELYYIDQLGMIGQLQFEGDSALVVSEFESPGGSSSGLAHDGTDLWQGVNSGILYRIDDSYDEISWFEPGPVKGIIASDESETINLMVDLSGFPANDTTVRMFVQLNDPENEEILIPVNAVYSIIDLGPDTSFCGQLNILLDAGEGYKQYLWSDDSEEQSLLVDSTYYGLGTTTIWAEATDHCGGTFRDTVLVTFQDCAGIFEVDKEVFVSVVPNPSEGIFEVIIDGKLNGLELMISDLNGRMIYQDHFNNSSNGISRHLVDLSKMSKGIYLLKLVHENKVYSEKIIIM